MLARKSAGERVSLGGRRTSQFQASPFRYKALLCSWEDSEGRSSYPGAQPQLQERKIFGFEIYIDNDILQEFGPLEQWFSNLQTVNGVEHIGFNSDLTIPDLNGRNIQVLSLPYRFMTYRWTRSINAPKPCFLTFTNPSKKSRDRPFQSSSLSPRAWYHFSSVLKAIR